MTKCPKDIVFDIQKYPATKIINRLIPSAIILNYKEQDNAENLSDLITTWLKNGAVHFATVGNNASQNEDAIDWVIIDEKEQDVVTTTHCEETPQEVLDFVMLHMGLNFDSFRIVFVSNINDHVTVEWDAMITQKKREAL